MLIGANTKSKAVYEAVNKQSNADNLDDLIDQADQLGDKPFYAVAASAPLMMINLGTVPTAIGAYTHTEIKALVDTEDPTLAQTSVVSDLGGVIGFALSDRSNRFNFGLQVRPITRYAYEDTIPITTLADKKELERTLRDDANKSAGLAVDAGILLTLADFWFPTIGLAVLNAPTGCKENYLNPYSKLRETTCGTVFQGSFGNPDALSTVDPTDIRAGISITPRLGRKLALRLGIDVHHIFLTNGTQNYGLSEVDSLKKFHAGAEVFVGNPLLPPEFTVGFGVGQGFYSMGTTAHLGFLSLELAVYGADVSTSATPKEDRRVVGSLAFDF